MSDHETIFETRKTRAARGAAVDNLYIPLIDNDFLTSQVLESKRRIDGIARPPVVMEDHDPFKSSRKTTSGGDMSSSASSAAVRYR